MQLGEQQISFRLFNKPFSPTWKNFSNILGFHESCNVDFDDALKELDRTRFWQNISGEIVCYRPYTDEIHNPTLRFIHNWLGVTLFLRENFRIARVELTLMYAMVKKVKVSPIILMAHYWLTILGLKKGGLTCTSWVTRLANELGLLDNANIAYITMP
jgi:hypothetical protein